MKLKQNRAEIKSGFLIVRNEGGNIKITIGKSKATCPHVGEEGNRGKLS